MWQYQRAVSIPAQGVGLVTNVGEVSVLFVTSKLAYYHNHRVVIDVWPTLSEDKRKQRMDFSLTSGRFTDLFPNPKPIDRKLM